MITTNMVSKPFFSMGPPIEIIALQITIIVSPKYYHDTPRIHHNISGKRSSVETILYYNNTPDTIS